MQVNLFGAYLGFAYMITTNVFKFVGVQVVDEFDIALVEGHAVLVVLRQSICATASNLVVDCNRLDCM